jgi:uncharacterized protein YunC (DUF1805 family)
MHLDIPFLCYFNPIFSELFDPTACNVAANRPGKRKMNHVLAPTITVLPGDVTGLVIVTGSHGGLYPGHLVLEAKARAAIFNDAGIGRDSAGVGALRLLQEHGKAAAAVAHTSARIGDTDDMMSAGIISTANALAAACGVSPGMTCREAAALLEGAPLGMPAIVAAHHEARMTWTCEQQIRPMILVDSASLVTEEDAGAIIVTGSHGGLIGGDPRKALRADGFAAIFNDAGIGKDDAGTTRLPALDNRGIAAFTIAASSARIGDARSTLNDGVISRINRTAEALGARAGQRAREICERWARQVP